MNQLASTKPISMQQKPSFKNLINNHNYLQCKFHTNKFQENLLSKRLKQLDVDEMKVRLKNQRDSNELISFMQSCQSSTGYLETKLKAHREGNLAKIIKLKQQQDKPKINTSNDFKSSQYPHDPHLTQKSLHLFNEFNLPSHSSTPTSKKSISSSNNSASLRLEPLIKVTSESSQSTFSSVSSFSEMRKDMEPKYHLSLPKTQTKLIQSNFSDSSSEMLSHNAWLTSTQHFDSDNESLKSHKSDYTREKSKNIFPRVKKEEITNVRRSKMSLKLDRQPEFESHSLNVLLSSNDFLNINNESSLTNRRGSSNTKLLAARKEVLARQKQVFPMQVSMSRSLLRKKQSEFVIAHQINNSIELSNTLRQTQENINNRVKQFSTKTGLQIL